MTIFRIIRTLVFTAFFAAAIYYVSLQILTPRYRHTISGQGDCSLFSTGMGLDEVQTVLSQAASTYSIALDGEQLDIGSGTLFCRLQFDPNWRVTRVESVNKR